MSSWTFSPPTPATRDAHGTNMVEVAELRAFEGEIWLLPHREGGDLVSKLSRTRSVCCQRTPILTFYFVACLPNKSSQLQDKIGDLG
jgi:hypothetical protein